MIRHRVNSYAAHNYKYKDTVVFVQYNFEPNHGMGIPAVIPLDLSSGYGNRAEQMGPKSDWLYYSTHKCIPIVRNYIIIKINSSSLNQNS